jgi:hypothetical protein
MYSSGAEAALTCDEQKRLAREDAERAPELRVVSVRHWRKGECGEGHPGGQAGTRVPRRRKG